MDKHKNGRRADRNEADSGRSAKRRRGPPPAVVEEIRRRLSEREVQGMEALFALRATARQIDNTIGEWMAGKVGSVARYQILMALWATKGDGIPHTEIVEAMGVTRATVSGLMAALERDGLVKSSVDGDDRRKLIARLTAKGEAVISKEFESNLARFRVVFASLSSDELTSFTALLHRFREGFTIPSNPHRGPPRGP
jgi:DNA-binding MarR family transcriptional regulator